MRHKLLNIGGGATKAIQLAVAAIEVHKKWKPTIIAGISAGAIIALPLALGMYDSLVNEAVDIEPDEMFTIRPTKNGTISARGWFRALGGVVGMKEKYSFGLQDTRHFLRSYITETLFNTYKMDPAMPEIIIMSVDFVSGKPVLHHAKQGTYDEYIEHVESSCHIPIMTQAVEDRVDGGVWAHNPEWYLLDRGIVDADEVVSIYAREEEFDIKEDVERKYKKHVFNYITRTLEVFNVALSSAGQSAAKWYCVANNIKHIQLFCPQILDETYDFDSMQLEQAMIETLCSVRDQLKDKL